MEQRSPEWFQARKKKFTASEIVRLCADGSRKMTDEELVAYKEENPKGRKTTTWDIPEGLKTYALEKAIEHFLDPEEDSFLSQAVQDGKEREPLAFEKFRYLKSLQFLDVKESSFVTNDKNSGSSPDGEVSDNSVLEMKCPNKTTFFKVVLTDYIDPKYFFQMQKQMKDTGANQCYYFVYYLQDGEEFWHEIIVPRCEETISLIEERIVIAAKLRDEYIAIIRKKAQWIINNIEYIEVIDSKVISS